MYYLTVGIKAICAKRFAAMFWGCCRGTTRGTTQSGESWLRNWTTDLRRSNGWYCGRFPGFGKAGKYYLCPWVNNYTPEGSRARIEQGSRPIIMLFSLSLCVESARSRILRGVIIYPRTKVGLELWVLTCKFVYYFGEFTLLQKYSNSLARFN